MRALLQRATRGEVRVDGTVVGSIGEGLVILLGVGHDDTEAIAMDLARRVAELRIFRDAEGRTNRSLLETRGSALVISQFTLYADTRRGRRPGFTTAGPAELAERLWRSFAAALETLGVSVATPIRDASSRPGGRFTAVGRITSPGGRHAARVVSWLILIAAAQSPPWNVPTAWIHLNASLPSGG